MREAHSQRGPSLRRECLRSMLPPTLPRGDDLHIFVSRMSL